MAFDGLMMTLVKKELEGELIGSKISQIYQPSKDELVFAFKTKKLLIRLSDSPRVHLTECSIENPKTPPMMCMLLRKRLCSARLDEIVQPASERILIFVFEALSEVGDRERLSLAVEIMGRYSNAVLIDASGNIIDSIRRIDFSDSRERALLPKMKYELPEAQPKLDINENTDEAIADMILELGADDKAALSAVRGISPIIAREIIFRASKSDDLRIGLIEEIKRIRELLSTGGEPTMVLKTDSSPMDTSFSDILQYEGALEVRRYESFSKLLDGFYGERDQKARMKAKAQGLNKLISNAVERLSRKVNLQRSDLKKCADREELRIKGDLLQANLNRIENGASSVTVENFYDENGGEMTIKLNPAISPAKNAQKFYKEYNKAKTREQMLKVQISLALEELSYLESVSDCLERAQTEAELSDIRSELKEQGYIKEQKNQKKKDKPLPPLEYKSPEGYRILVGRNNRQNDLLTLKTAGKGDIWLHTKNIPGSHTVIECSGKEVGESTLVYAASLAAFHSKARNSSQVPVDYTRVKNVSKPRSAKPGKVIYVKYNTIYVDPLFPFSPKPEGNN